MKKLLKDYVFDALLLIIIGLVFLLWPTKTMELFCRVIGIVLMVMGVIGILEFSLRKEDRSAWSLILGILQFGIGLWLLVHPKFFINFIPYVAGVLVAVGAIIALIHAIRAATAGSAGAIVAIILATITLILALLVVFNPGFIAKAAMVWIGISLIVEGVTLLVSLSRQA